MADQINKEMPQYQCHKKVRAVKIRDIGATPTGATILPEDDFPPFDVTDEWLLKHDPDVGGYYVVYEGGYSSYSPAKDFEAGYTKI